MDETISVQEAAGILGVTPKTVRLMLNNGELKGSLIGIGRGHWRVSKEHVSKLVEMKFYHCGKEMSYCPKFEKWQCECGYIVKDKDGPEDD